MHAELRAGNDDAQPIVLLQVCEGAGCAGVGEGGRGQTSTREEQAGRQRSCSSVFFSGLKGSYQLLCHFFGHVVDSRQCLLIDLAAK